jgi:hypothetical protein
MHLLAAPFILGGLILKIYNNKKNRLVPQKKDTLNDNRKLQEDRIHNQSSELS